MSDNQPTLTFIPHRNHKRAGRCPICGGILEPGDRAYIIGMKIVHRDCFDELRADDPGISNDPE